ncbi:MAG: hypothetical protein OXT65_05625 [Alphaproteobacteria bacterium]|nr:hypothetical protein [Alphaproteobacteria bacterium]
MHKKVTLGRPLNLDNIAETFNEVSKALLVRRDLLNTWTDNLVDPELGPVGKDFHAAFVNAECKEFLGLKTTHNALFNSYAYPPFEGEEAFKNQIVYGTTVLDDAALLFSARCHEIIHALQYVHAPALHADPFNAETEAFISPRDYLLRKERIEQDAYAKGAWLCTLATDDHPDIREKMDSSMLSVKKFEELRAQHGNLHAALTAGAHAAANTLGVWVTNGPKTTAADNWHHLALKEYEAIIDRRLKDGKSITFVRMEDNDVLALGQSFGPNPFAAADGTLDPSFRQPSSFGEDIEKRLATLNAKIGITDETALPTLGSTIKNTHASRQEFLTAMRTPRKVENIRPDT